MWAQLEPSSQPLIDLAQYGILGLIVIGFVLGWIWPKPAVERLIKTHDEQVKNLEEKIDSLSAEVKGLKQTIESRKLGV